MTMPSADIQETVNMKISLIRQTDTFSLQVKKGFYQNLMRLRIRKELPLRRARSAVVT